MADDKSDLIYEPVILVTRGDERPKKNWESKKHPTYETSIRIKGPKGSAPKCDPHVICKFFDQYRTLHENLVLLGIGEDLKIPINAPFPPTHKSSVLGFQMTEDQLQQRCYKLNKWMQAIFANFPLFPEEAQKLISQFLSLEDDDAASEANKELILTIIKRKYETPNLGMGPGPSTRQPQTFPGYSGSTESNAGTINNNGGGNSTSTVPAKLISTNDSKPEIGKSDAVTSITAIPQSGSVGNLTSLEQKPDSAPDSKPQTTDNRRLSAAPSTVSEVYKGLSAPELDEYSKETYVNDFLATSVLRGEMMGKNPDDKKAHHSYETIIRILPFEEITAPNVADIDSNEYSKFVAIPPVSVAFTFDRYRSLKQELESVGVFTRENIRGVNDYNDAMSKLYNGGSNSILAIKLDCDFPRTYKKSSMGISLSESEIQERAALLNNWMGKLLKAFHKFSPAAQQKIVDFLELNCNELNAGDSEDKTLLNFQDQANCSKIYILMLRGKFSGPKIKPPEPPSDKKKDKKKEKEKKLEVVPAVTISTTDAVVLTEGVNEAVVLSSLPETAPEGKRVPQERPDDKSEVSNANSVVMTHQKMAEFLKETFVYSFLGVKVTKGDMIGKDNDGKKKHQGYETVIRILPFREIVYTDKDKVDQDAYNKMQGSMGYVSTTKVFDGYRTLKMNLEKYKIYCHDFVPAGTKLDEHSFVLEASFPKTYSRSSMGFKLSEMQLNTRTAQLNRWVGTLMSKFHLYPIEAQELICDFLTLADDDPAEPQGKTILSMLRRKYVPPLIVVIQPLIDKKRQDENNNGNSVSSYGYSKSNNGQKKSDDDNSDGENRDGHAVASNGCCVIM